MRRCYNNLELHWLQENPACTKNDNRDKVLLTSSMAEQKEENKKYRESHHQINFAGNFEGDVHEI